MPKFVAVVLFLIASNAMASQPGDGLLGYSNASTTEIPSSC